MRRLAGVLFVFVGASLVWAGDAKQYPLTLKVLETIATTYSTGGERTTTNCTSLPGSDDINCTSRQTPSALHTDLVSIGEASDGNTYEIECVPGVGGRFFQGGAEAIAAQNGTTSSSGCMVPPGTYRARWDKGHLKVLHEKNGKAKETTFTVLSSKPTVRTETAQPAAAPNPATSTLLKLSSSPDGADIELDGNFIGHTPSSVPAANGDHSIKISKAKYKPWERIIKTAGGEITIAAELESEPK